MVCSRAGTTRRPGRWRWAPARACALLAGASVLAACSSSPPDPVDPAPTAQQVALRVSTTEGARELSSEEVTELEGDVGGVISRYLVGGFLGVYPRERFVGAFGGFTSGAAALAARDIRVLTAARVGDAESVRARQLDARLSVLADEGEVVGATAYVDLAFEATMRGGSTQDVTLTGRLMLVEQDGRWSVFGFDLAGDDGAPPGEEAP